MWSFVWISVLSFFFSWSLAGCFSFIYLISVFFTIKTTKPKRKTGKQLLTLFVVEASTDSLGKPTPLPCGGVIFPHALESPGYDS